LVPAGVEKAAIPETRYDESPKCEGKCHFNDRVSAMHVTPGGLPPQGASQQLELLIIPLRCW
jgi:hypothetical protein